MFNQRADNTVSVSGSGDLINPQGLALGAQTFQPTSGRNGVMYLFSPTQILDTTVRPLNYIFDGEFVRDLENVLAKPTRSMKSYDMLGSAAARTAITPNYTGRRIETSRFSTCWTFTLTIDDSLQFDGLGTMSISPITTRTIFSGYISDEPVSSSGCINPNAVYVITHKTEVAIQSADNGTGFYHPSINSDYEIVDLNMQQQLTANPESCGATQFNLDPHAVLEATNSEDAYGLETIVSPNPSDIASGTIMVDAGDQVPHSRLNKITRSIGDAYFTKSLGENDAFTNDFSTFKDNVSISMSNPNTSGRNRKQGYKLFDRPFTAQELDTFLGGCLNVTIANQPYELGFNVTDNSDPTPENIFSSMIQSSIQPIITRLGLASVAFRYATYIQEPGNDGFIGEIPDAFKGTFEFQITEPLCVGVPESSVFNMVENLKMDLRTHLFPILRVNQGDFDLTVQSSLGFSTIVNLKFMSSRSHNNDFLHTSTLLGGVQTNMVGDSAMLQSNSAALTDVLRTVYGAGSPDNNQYNYQYAGGQYY